MTRKPAPTPVPEYCVLCEKRIPSGAKRFVLGDKKVCCAACADDHMRQSKR